MAPWLTWVVTVSHSPPSPANQPEADGAELVARGVERALLLQRDPSQYSRLITLHHLSSAHRPSHPHHQNSGSNTHLPDLGAPTSSTLPI